MAQIVQWFPTAIYSETNLLSEKNNIQVLSAIDDLKNQINSGGQDWQGGTYTSHDMHNLVRDPRFDLLINEVTHHVNVFAKAHNSEAKFKCHTAWFNVSKKNNFQEYHYHAASTFSAVYYVKIPPDSGQIVFENPVQDMCPIEKIKDRNDLSFVQIGYTPVERSIIIFRSHLRHMVKAEDFEGERISIAFNFEHIR
jgi:uncharacterized protein (TIGR02466 family)